jgi:hypothetical protein
MVPKRAPGRFMCGPGLATPKVDFHLRWALLLVACYHKTPAPKVLNVWIKRRLKYCYITWRSRLQFASFKKQRQQAIGPELRSPHTSPKLYIVACHVRGLDAT